jgi:phosphoglycerate dehydrogenase-like enzyme
MSGVRVHIAPFVDDEMKAAVERNGGEVLEDPAEADAIIWTNPRDPEALKEMLTSSPARWVQLPFAGIESFFEADAIDPARTWTCTKGIYGHATAEHALALTLAAARRLAFHARSKTWTYMGGFGAEERRLAGSTVVVVGTGGIGSALAEMLKPLNARVVGVNRSGREMAGAERTDAIGALDEVIGEADFVVLAASHTPETHGLIDARRLKAMKPTAWLVNVARGGLVMTEDLVTALEAGDIGGAALDVTDPEPLPDGHPLWDLPNVLITPHVANTWDMARPELNAMVGRNVAHYGAGEELEGLVDPSAGY